MYKVLVCLRCYLFHIYTNIDANKTYSSKGNKWYYLGFIIKIPHIVVARNSVLYDKEKFMFLPRCI